jgi:GR25 family glycosyltransferase involved in LPS biosynthesis
VLWLPNEQEEEHNDNSNSNSNNKRNHLYSYRRESETHISVSSSSSYDYNPNNIWIINLSRSPVRRLHMYSECAREGILNVVRVFNAVDGLSLSEFVISNVLGEQAVLSTGEIGCFLSHITMWWMIVRTSKPFAVIIEDDAVLTENFYSKLNYYIRKLSHEDWDILFLERCGEMRQHTKDKDCRSPVYKGMERTMAMHSGSGNNEGTGDGARLYYPGLLHIDGTGCIPSGVRGYVLSQSGAKKLVANAVPLRRAIDVHMADMIYSGQLNAYCTLPSIIRMHQGGLKSSDTASMPVYHTKINNKIRYTARDGVFPKCSTILCVLQYRVKEKHETDQAAEQEAELQERETHYTGKMHTTTALEE